jgi:hypothetical protein
LTCEFEWVLWWSIGEGDWEKGGFGWIAHQWGIGTIPMDIKEEARGGEPAGKSPPQMAPDRRLDKGENGGGECNWRQVEFGGPLCSEATLGISWKNVDSV